MDPVRFALVFPASRRAAEIPWKDEALRAFAPSLLVGPECWYSWKQRVPWTQWERFCRERSCSAFLGVERVVGGWATEEIWVVTPAGRSDRCYTKHSTAGIVAWEHDPYDVEAEIRPFDLPGVGAVAPAICHDGYLGGVFARYARQKPTLFTNSTYGGVLPEKWHSVHRLRSIEHGVPTLCAMHQADGKRGSIPFAFDSCGRSVSLRRTDGRPEETSTKPGILLGEVELGASVPRDDVLAQLPAVAKRLVANGEETGPFAMRFDLAAGMLRPRSAQADDRPVEVVRLVEHEILDFWSVFRALDERPGHRVVFQSWWRRLPARPEQLSHVLLGRCLENLAPFVLTDDDRIYEVVETAGATKVMRRSRCDGSTAWVDLRYALGLKNALKMTRGYAGTAALQEFALEQHRAWAAAARPSRSARGRRR